MLYIYRVFQKTKQSYCHINFTKVEMTESSLFEVHVEYSKGGVDYTIINKTRESVQN